MILKSYASGCSLAIVGSNGYKFVESDFGLCVWPRLRASLSHHQSTCGGGHRQYLHDVS